MSAFGKWLQLALAGACLVGLSGCSGDTDSKNSAASPASAETPYNPWHPNPDAQYVGAQRCVECHQQAFDDWKESDHHKAMEPATAETVLGDFNDTEFDHFGHVTRFYRKGDEYWVNTENDQGERVDYKIDYTFGFEPLQQYLIAFPGGRYQALQVCWDSRPAEDGGQRWFHLYQDEAIPPEDELHWTRRHFNWNFMCADCHSTDLHKNFDPQTDSYHTTWSEMNVSCEACHGPSSEHLKWAKAEAASEKGDAPASGDTAELSDYLKSKGLVVTLKEPQVGSWIIDPDTNMPKRSVPLASNGQVETCARCHAHRTLLEDNFHAGQPFLDSYAPSVLTDQLYHHDGQVDEEVYVYGSFVQSKMYHAGVRCTDCHHPHTMKPLAPGNALCVRCHQADQYDTPAHHFHQPESTGASCVDCHMPTKNYMVVDARRDHSLRVPRPDLSRELGTPNACNQCHTDKDVDWAAAAFKERWPGIRNDHYGERLADARRSLGSPESFAKLHALAEDSDVPGIVRGSAFETLRNAGPPSPETLRLIERRLTEESEPIARQQALAALENAPPAQRLQVAAASLEDPSRAVRSEAARLLAPARSMMDAAQAAAFDRAADEYLTRANAIDDRAAGHMGLALFYSDLGDFAKAEAAYRTAFKVEPEHVPSRVNLAEMLYQQSRIAEAEALYREAVTESANTSGNGLAHDALARFLIRQKRYDEGLAELKLAVAAMPEHAQSQYFLGVALNSMGQFAEALPHLQKAHRLDPQNPEYLIGLVTICRDAGELSTALSYAEQLLQLDPASPQYQQLVAQLRAMSQQ